MWLPVEHSWRLNERHYGDLQGLNKAETAARFGEAQVKIWRRSYDTPPPPLAPTTRATRHATRAMPRSPAELPPAASPSRTPSPASARTGRPTIAPVCARAGGPHRRPWQQPPGAGEAPRRGLGRGHRRPRIPTGIPLVYELDDDLRPQSHRYLGDPDRIAAATAAVAAQGRAGGGRPVTDPVLPSPGYHRLRPRGLPVHEPPHGHRPASSSAPPSSSPSCCRRAAPGCPRRSVVTPRSIAADVASRSASSGSRSSCSSCSCSSRSRRSRCRPRRPRPADRASAPSRPSVADRGHGHLLAGTMLTRRDRAVIGGLFGVVRRAASAWPSVGPTAGTPTACRARCAAVRPYREGILAADLSEPVRGPHCDWAPLLRLLRPRPPWSGETFVPDLAERWTVDETGAIYTFTLRADAVGMMVLGYADDCRLHDRGPPGSGI